MTDQKMRVRFAPSPTGTLHLGSARSALYNWLQARHMGAHGVYVLRIEDTDQQRSTPEHVEQALKVFRWLGLDWDEGPGVEGSCGPYFQSQRTDLYAQALEQLRAGSNSYPCFCTSELLDADRDAAKAAGKPLVYSGRCRNLSADERSQRLAAGESHVVRIRIPEGGVTIVDDMILGPTRFENALIGDVIVARTDGSVLYNFANVVDDHTMGITHVIRGNDHLSNTPKQILMYQALGYELPRFAHIPMIMGPDGAKLSKRRHHTATVEQLAEQGYEAEAVRNGLALLGWNRDDDTTTMSTAEMIEAFDVTRVKKSPAAIDYDKMKFINASHLRAMPIDAWVDGYVSWRDAWLSQDAEHYAAAVGVDPRVAAMLVQEKAEMYSQVPALVEFLLDPFVMTDDAWGRLVKVDEAYDVLEQARSLIEGLDDFSVEGIEQALRGLCSSMELKPRVVFAPIRFAVTGRTVTPGLFESIEALGQGRSIERISSVLSRLKAIVGAST